MTKSGSGTVTLRGLNAYTGDTTVSGGTLLVASAGQLGSGNYAGKLTLAANSMFKYGSTADQILSGVVSGTGRLVKEQLSALSLTAANDFVGDITLNNGSFAVDGSGQLGGGTYTGNLSLGPAATFNYNSVANQEFNGAITGTGTLVKGTSSTISLAASNAFTGDIRINSGQLSVTSSGQYSFENNVSGSGRLDISTSGDITLKGKINLLGQNSSVAINSPSFTIAQGGSIKTAGSNPSELQGSINIITTAFDNLNNSATALQATNGRYLVWVGSSDAVDPTKRGSLLPSFIQYGIQNGSTTRSTGNGFAYKYLPILSTVLSGKTKTYDGTDTVLPLSFTDFSSTTGLISTDNLAALAVDNNASNLSARYLGTNAGNQSIVLDNLSFTTTNVNGALVYGYRASRIGQSFIGSGEILQKQIASPFTAVNKTYDGNVSAQVLASFIVNPQTNVRQLVSSDIIIGDEVTLNFGNPTFNSANVSLVTQITVPNVFIGGSQVGNYQIASSISLPATIEPKVVTFIPSSGQSKFILGDPDKVYNGKVDVEDAYLEGQVTGAISADLGKLSIDFSSTVLVYEDKKVGDTEILATQIFSDIYDYLLIDASSSSLKTDYTIAGPLDMQGNFDIGSIVAKITSAFTAPNASSMTITATPAATTTTTPAATTTITPAATTTTTPDAPATVTPASSNAGPISIALALDPASPARLQLANDIFGINAKPTSQLGSINTPVSSLVGASGSGAGTVALATNSVAGEGVESDSNDSAENDSAEEEELSIANDTVQNTQSVMPKNLALKVLETSNPTSFQIEVSLDEISKKTAGPDDKIIAELTSGKSLPDWLLFDPDNGQFTGAAPSSLASIEVNIISIDSVGNRSLLPIIINFNK